MNYSTQALLDRLLARYGPQEFGKICQALLELSFLESGFRTQSRWVGRPDLVISRDDKEWAIEVRVPTGDNVIIHKGEIGELKRRYGNRANIAFATLLLGVKPRWVIADCSSLTPGTHNKIALEVRAFPDLTESANASFSSVVPNNFEVAFRQGVDGLRKIIKRKSQA